MPGILLLLFPKNQNYPIADTNLIFGFNCRIRGFGFDKYQQALQLRLQKYLIPIKGPKLTSSIPNSGNLPQEVQVIIK